MTVPVVVLALLGMVGTRRWLGLVVAAIVVLLNGEGLVRWTLLPPQVGVVAALAFLVWVTSRVFQLLMRAPAVTRNLIAGALSAYLMLALAWALAYGAVEVAWPGSINAPAPADGSPAVQVHTLMYLSAITIMTIGYGDVTPVAPIARTLAMLEGLAGLVFSAVVLGALVSTVIESRRRSEAKAGGGTDGVDRRV